MTDTLYSGHELEIRLHPDVESWYLGICTTDPATADLIEDAIDQLAREDPTAGRPLVDRVHGSRYHNMKELRPPSTGTSEVRILFAFDPTRQAGNLSCRWRQGRQLATLVHPSDSTGR